MDNKCNGKMNSQISDISSKEMLNNFQINCVYADIIDMQTYQDFATEADDVRKN